ncbi:MAG: c-type cytochrome [Bryobacteraceae bacterium]|nr:c-type cytochrome [Bryobacteraceae bacterium]
MLAIMSRIPYVVLPLLIALPLGAQSGKKKNPAIGNPAAIEAGRTLYMGGCAGCHGQGGQGGRGPNLKGRGMWHSLDDEGLFKTIQKGVPGADMPPSNLSEDQLWQLVAFVRSINAPAVEQKIAGNPQAGEAVFAKAGCANCHQIRGRGGLTGPDLSNIGGTQTAEDIRENISDPAADWNESYRKVVAVGRDGRKVEGILRNRNNYSMQIQDAAGRIHLIAIGDLKEYSLDRRSPMPNDYKTRLSRQEMDDLVAYLSRQSMRPPETDSEKGSN